MWTRFNYSGIKRFCYLVAEETINDAAEELKGKNMERLLNGVIFFCLNLCNHTSVF